MGGLSRGKREKRAREAALAVTGRTATASVSVTPNLAPSIAPDTFQSQLEEFIQACNRVLDERVAAAVDFTGYRVSLAREGKRRKRKRMKGMR